MENGLLDQQVKKLDHFNDVKRQMNASVEKRSNLQRKVGQKLVHCKLKGHEDVSDEFKRLIKIKVQGTHYAVKEAQMQPLIAKDTVLPSKAVQTRIEGCEREIFSLLSTENDRSGAEKSDVKIDMDNCLNVLNSRHDNLQIKLEELGRIEKDLGQQEPFTEEGFHERDVQLHDSLQKDKEELEMEFSLIERNVQQSSSGLDESKVQLREAEAKITTLQNFNASKREDIARARKSYKEARARASAQRETRNQELCRVILQRRALKKEGGEKELQLAATESLHSRKSDIEKDLQERREKLRMLKMKYGDLEKEEKCLEKAGRTNQSQLSQVGSSLFYMFDRTDNLLINCICNF